MAIILTATTYTARTSFASLITDVTTIVNRPDLATNEIPLAIKAATLKAHQSDDYIKDLNEYSLQFDTSDYYQSLDYKALIPNWRKPRYMRKYDYTGGAPGKILTYIEPEEVIDGFGADRTDIFYVAGSNIQIKSSDALQYLLVGAYTNPTVTAVGYSSWIADDHPFAIIYEAAAIVFKMISLNEQSAVFRDMVKEQYQLLRQHAVTGLGS